MSQKVTEVKVFEYIEATDSFVVEVNGAVAQYAAEMFSTAHAEYQKNIEADFSQPQTIENYCLAMIYEMHFEEEPVNLCYTFYRVNH